MKTHAQVIASLAPEELARRTRLLASEHRRKGNGRAGYYFPKGANVWTAKRRHGGGALLIERTLRAPIEYETGKYVATFCRLNNLTTETTK